MQCFKCESALEFDKAVKAKAVDENKKELNVFSITFKCPEDGIKHLAVIQQSDLMLIAKEGEDGG